MAFDSGSARLGLQPSVELSGEVVAIADPLSQPKRIDTDLAQNWTTSSKTRKRNGHEMLFVY